MEDISVKFVKTCKDFGVKVTYINKDGIRVRLKISLKKLLITGLLAVGIAIAAKQAGKEASFKLEQGKIENLKETADEISKLDNNTTIVDVS